MTTTSPIEPEAAVELVLARCDPLPAEEVRLESASGRVLAESVTARDAVPPFDNSAMDGFAVRSADLAAASSQGPVILEVIGESRAGHPSAVEVVDGKATAISTGAVVPRGADAVAEIEIVDESPGQEAPHRVEISRPVAEGRGIRRAGSDVPAGSTVLEAGVRLTSTELGSIASAGLDPIRCARRPRLATLTTGDELTPPGEALPPGGIRDSSAISIPALAREMGAEPVHRESVPDSLQSTRTAIREAIGAADIVVICGGVSVGPHDHVKPALEELGVEEIFWRVALKPGKPTWFGAAADGTLVFGLPGNPVSAMVTFNLFVGRAIRAMLGMPAEPEKVKVPFAERYESNPERTEYVRCALEIERGAASARLTGPDQSSHVLRSLLGASGLARIPKGSGTVEPGSIVEVELFEQIPSKMYV